MDIKFYIKKILKTKGIAISDFQKAEAEFSRRREFLNSVNQRRSELSQKTTSTQNVLLEKFNEASLAAAVEAQSRRDSFLEATGNFVGNAGKAISASYKKPEYLEILRMALTKIIPTLEEELEKILAEDSTIHERRELPGDPIPSHGAVHLESLINLINSLLEKFGRLDELNEGSIVGLATKSREVCLHIIDGSPISLPQAESVPVPYEEAIL